PVGAALAGDRVGAHGTADEVELGVAAGVDDQGLRVLGQELVGLARQHFPHGVQSPRKSMTARAYSSGMSPKGICLACSSTSRALDRKSTHLNSSHVKISYAVFCL